MFGSGMLDVAIGIIFIYLFLSLICSIITEWVAGLRSLRAENLEVGIRKLLNNPNGNGLAQKFYAHPLVKGITKDGHKPSYIPSRIFMLTLMDIIAPSEANKGSKTISEFREAVGKLQYDEFKKTILVLLDDADNDLNKARQNIEKWFNDAMDRVAGWYKRETHLISFLCALFVAISLNADTISIANTLFRDPAMRAGLATAAQETLKRPIDDSKDLQKTVEQIKEEIQKLRFPLGIPEKVNFTDLAKNNINWWVSKILGLFITTVAVSLGAPFWFDILNKFVNIRSVGKQPEKK